jgi:hypothetical protein
LAAELIDPPSAANNDGFALSATPPHNQRNQSPLLNPLPAPQGEEEEFCPAPFGPLAEASAARRIHEFSRN